MPITWDDMQRMKRVEQQANELGFMLCAGNRTYDPGSWDRGVILLKPKDEDALPIYNRDAELFYGTVEQIEIWLRGILWAREYDHIMKVSSPQKRTKAEQDERNRQLMETIRKGILVEGETE